MDGMGSHQKYAQSLETGSKRDWFKCIGQSKSCCSLFYLTNRFALFAFFAVDELTAEGAKTGYKRFIMKISDRIYRIDRINSSCESCYPVHIYMARLPKVILDLSPEHKKEGGGAVIAYRKGTADEDAQSRASGGRIHVNRCAS